MTEVTEMQSLLDEALESEWGISVPCPTPADAVTLRYRLNYFRKLDRIQTKTIYQVDDPRYGVSVYDVLVLRIPPNSNVLYIEHRLKIEGLPRIRLGPR